MGSSTNLLLKYQHPELVASHSVTDDQTEEQDMEACRLESRLMTLESELKKIDAFKRELPLCMQLLHDAIEASKEQLALHRFSSHKQLQRPVSRSFDNRSLDVQSDNNGCHLLAREKPLNSAYANKNEGEQTGKRHHTHGIGDASHWINIWNPRAELNSGYQTGYRSFVSSEERSRWYMHEQAFSTPARPTFCSKQKLGGAFAPFSRDSRLVQPTPRPGAINPADLALKCPDSVITGPPKAWEIVQQQAESSTGLELSICTKFGNSPQQVKGTVLKDKKVESDTSNGIQLTRKTRRSWSPELHRLFVDALQNLGGAQATPKQIRELMKVEGLTNDEVKSHLQKYRLHTKRFSSSPTSSSQEPGVISVGRPWDPSEYASHSYNTTSRQSLSCETSVTQENVTELCCSGQVHSQVSSCCVKQSTLPHKRHLWKGPVRLKGHPSAGCFRLSDVGGEESVGEAVKPKNSVSKGHHHPGLQSYESDEIEDHCSSGNQANSFGEDDKDFKDSQGPF